jgi:hypothetical protein
VSEWLNHDGDQRPCADDTLVDVILRNGEERLAVPANQLKWPNSISYNPDRHEGNIVKWRKHQ